MRHRSLLQVLALLTLPFTVLGACRSPAEPTATYEPAVRLQGSWRWVSSLDVRTGALHTPATDGFTATLRFVADSA